MTENLDYLARKVEEARKRCSEVKTLEIHPFHKKQIRYEWDRVYNKSLRRYEQALEERENESRG